MRYRYIGILALASVGGLACSPDTSDLPIEYSIGDGEPVLGAKVSMHVTPEFSRDDARSVFSALESQDLRAVLDSVACGEPVPDFTFTVSLWRQAPMHVRHIEVRESPWLGVGSKNECLVGGMKFFVIKTVEEIERGKRPKPKAGDPSLRFGDVGGGLKGVRCDCAARANGLPGVRYEHWPIS